MDLNAPERINDKAIEILQKRYDKVEPKFVKAVVAWIEKFRTSSGNLVRSKENISRLSTFKRAIERYLIQSGYNDMVSGFLSNFDTLATEQQTIQSELNGLDIKKSFLNPFKSWAVNNVVAAMQGQGLTTTLINPLKQELLVAVNQGSSLTDVVTSIAGQLTTTEARQGVLKRISLQASRDALLQYDGVVNEAVRKVYKMDALLYVGSIVKDSRKQCEQWVQETKNGKLGLLLFEDLESEIEWANNEGTGMIPNTTPENFCQNRGGFNCRHIAYPVRSANYVKEVETPKEPEAPKEVETPEEVEFVEAKTLKEAESYTKKYLDVNFVDFKGLDLQTANDLNRTVYNYKQIFKEYKINGIGSAQQCNKAIKLDLNAFYKASDNYKEIVKKYGQKSADKYVDSWVNKKIPKIGKGTIAYSVNYRNVQLEGKELDLSKYNGVYVNNIRKSEEIEKIVTNGKNSKWFTSSAKGLKYINDHELGHEIDKFLNIKSDTDFDKIYTSYNNKGVEYLTNNLSKYGATAGGLTKNKKDEFIAEAWAEYCSTESPREISKEIGDLILGKYYNKYNKGTDFDKWKLNTLKILRK